MYPSTNTKYISSENTNISTEATTITTLPSTVLTKAVLDTSIQVPQYVYTRDALHFNTPV